MDEALLSLRTELARERGLRTTAEAALRRCGPRTVAYRQRDAQSVALLHQKLGVLNSMLEAAQTEQRESLAVISALNAEMETLHRELETERERNRVLTMRSSSSTSSSSSSSSSSFMTPRVQSKSWRSAAPQRLERPGVGGDGTVDGPMTPPTTPAESPRGELASGLSITSDNEELAAATLSEAQHQLHKAAQHQHHDHDHDHSGGANGGASSESSMVELAAAALSAAQHQHQNRFNPFTVVDGEVYSAGEQSSDDQDCFVRGLSSEEQQSSSDFFALVKDTCGKENTLHHRSTCGACVSFIFHSIV